MPGELERLALRDRRSVACFDPDSVQFDRPAGDLNPGETSFLEIVRYCLTLENRGEQSYVLVNLDSPGLLRLPCRDEPELPTCVVHLEPFLLVARLNTSGFREDPDLEKVNGFGL